MCPAFPLLPLLFHEAGTRTKERRCCRDAARCVQEGLGQGLVWVNNVRAIDLPASAELLSLLGELPPQKATVSSAGGNPCPGSQAGRCACVPASAREEACWGQRPRCAMRFASTTFSHLQQTQRGRDGTGQDGMGMRHNRSQVCCRGPGAAVLSSSATSPWRRRELSALNHEYLCNSACWAFASALRPGTRFKYSCVSGSVGAILALLRRSSHGQGSH